MRRLKKGAVLAIGSPRPLPSHDFVSGFRGVAHSRKSFAPAGLRAHAPTNRATAARRGGHINRSIRRSSPTVWRRILQKRWKNSSVVPTLRLPQASSACPFPPFSPAHGTSSPTCRNCALALPWQPVPARTHKKYAEDFSESKMNLELVLNLIGNRPISASPANHFATSRGQVRGR